MATNIASTVNVDNTFGCTFIQAILTSALWGLGSLQCYLYFEKFWKTDKFWLKAYITFLWMLDTAHQALISVGSYITFVKGIENPDLLFRMQKSAVAVTALSAFIDAMVQAFFVRRVWCLSNKSFLLTGALSVGVLTQFALTLAYFGRVVRDTEVSQLDEDVPLELAMNIVTTLTDSFIAAALIWLLRKARSGFKRSDTIINRLVTYTFGTSFITAICALAALISDAVAPHTLIYVLADFLIAKLYFNCLLASLNARSSLRAPAVNGVGGMSIHLGTFSSSTGESANSTSNSNKASHANAIECKVTNNVRDVGDQCV